MTYDSSKSRGVVMYWQISDFANGLEHINKGVIDKHVSSNQKFQIDQHLATATHKEMEKGFNGKVQQTFVSTALCASSQQNQDSKNEFYFDLCNSIAQSNLPCNK
ncbi:unnamed protein product [Acanthoscelides obtectus]|uniref:Uncharacterized protein n=1 Tax=Acanthoscelides obtectus TaxID=200917 RepID=A0A9P0K4R7_ACAOB|nr:unnamed protein product [Acanthoscelides obtectus]CAK1648069.1 hypothetical protein AOBTE_LOCUS15529 [Acanthoscelides obtectus]